MNPYLTLLAASLYRDHENKKEAQEHHQRQQKAREESNAAQKKPYKPAPPQTLEHGGETYSQNINGYYEHAPSQVRYYPQSDYMELCNPPHGHAWLRPGEDCSDTKWSETKHFRQTTAQSVGFSENAYVNPHAFQQYCDAIAENPHITKLEINGIPASCAPALAALIEKKKELTSLGLKGSRELDDTNLALILKACGKSGLETLNLRGCRFGPESEAALPDALAHIKALSLQDAPISSQGCTDAVNACTKNGIIEILDLSGQKLGAMGGGAVINCIKRANHLKSIKLNDVKLGHHTMHQLITTATQSPSLLECEIPFQYRSAEWLDLSPQHLAAYETLQETMKARAENGGEALKSHQWRAR